MRYCLVGEGHPTVKKITLMPRCRILLATIFFMCAGSLAFSQATQKFNNFVGGLPVASSVGTSDSFYLLQGGISRQVPFANVSGALPSSFYIASDPKYGWTCDSNDHSTQALALLSTVSNAGGGTIFFPPCQQAMFTGSISGTTLTVTAIQSGTIKPGMMLMANGLNRLIIRITAAVTGGGGAGTYTVDTPQIQGSEQMWAGFTYRADSQLLIPNDGILTQGYFGQVNIRLTGAGGGNNWFFNAPTQIPSPNASILDLRYQANDGNGKVESRGSGALMIDKLGIIDGGSSNSTPFIHGEATALTIRDNTFMGSNNATQDFIVLGDSTSNTDGSVTAVYVGYGTIIENNTFMYGNRGVYAKTFANNVYVIRNIFPLRTSAGLTAIEFDGSVGAGPVTNGEYVTGNLIEMDNTYTCGIKLTNVSQSFFAGNSFWDTGSQGVGNYCLNGSNVSGNVFIPGQSSSGASGSPFSDPSSNLPFNTVFGNFVGTNNPRPTQFQIFGSVASANIPPNTFVSAGTPPTKVYAGDVWNDGTNLWFTAGSGGITTNDKFALVAGGFVLQTPIASASSYVAAGVLGVSCNSGTVSTATLTVNNGIVTHC